MKRSSKQSLLNTPCVEHMYPQNKLKAIYANFIFVKILSVKNID